MGDTTVFNLHVEGGSENVRRRLAEVYTEYVFNHMFSAKDPEQVLAGDEWPEASCGAGEEMATKFHAIVDQARGDAKPNRIALVEDGKYEWNGDLFRYKRGLGWHRATVNNDGGVVVDSETLLYLIDKATDLNTLRKRVERVVGKAWE